MMTFLFTDIEGSMQLWEKHPEGMACALKRHDEILTALIENSGGRIIKHTGDGVFAVFGENAKEARPLECAVGIMLALMEEDWPEIESLVVRIALHSGKAERREDDYFGPVVNRTSRILDAGWGGQILVTDRIISTYDLPEGAEVHDLGEHMLKDLTNPQRLLYITHPGLNRREFPPIRSLNCHRHNLPVQPTEFIGRLTELEEINQLLSDPPCSLLTLLGPGGAGKTRVALQAAVEAIEFYPDGAFFVALAPVQSADHLVQAITVALGLDFYASEDLEVQMLEYLKNREMLLVMDNFEHLIDGAMLMSEIVNKAPGVTILVTSRHRLNLKCEWLYEIGGMRYKTDKESAGSSSALKLFESSARRLVRNFELSESNRREVQHICHLVEGLPLAIELAASWIRVLDVEDIGEQIGESLTFLESTLQDIPDRHQNLGKVFKYSWQLLSESEQEALSGLSCFLGGFDKAAANSVTGTSITMLAALADRSLLHRAAENRFELHEVTRQYADSELSLDPERYHEVRDRHCTHYINSLVDIGRSLNSPDRKNTMRMVTRDIENFRAAWGWALQTGRYSDIARSCKNLYHVFCSKGWFRDCSVLFDEALLVLDREEEKKDEARHATGALLIHQGWLRILAGHYDKGAADFERSIGIFREEDDPGNLSISFCRLSSIELFRGNFEVARKINQKAVEAAEESGKPNSISMAFNNQGNIERRSGNLAIAEECYLKGLEVLDKSVKSHAYVVCTGNLGIVNYRMGKLEKAKQLVIESLKISEELDDLRLIAEAHGDLANILRAIGEKDEARIHINTCLRHNREMGIKSATAIALANLATIEAEFGNTGKAKKCFAEMIELARQLSRPMMLIDSLCGYADVVLKQGDLEEAFRYYEKALKVVQGSPVTRSILRIIVSLGEAFARTGKNDLALDLLAFAKEQPASSSEIPKIIRKAISKIDPQPSLEQIEAARERARCKDSDELIAEMLTELKP